MMSERRHTPIMLGISMLLLSAPSSCETQETTGQLTAREIRINEPDSSGPDSIVLNGGTITLVDEKGRKAILSATGIRFLSADGKVVAETPATSPPSTHPPTAAETPHASP